MNTVAGAYLHGQAVVSDSCEFRAEWNRAFIEAYEKGEAAEAYQFAARLEANEGRCGLKFNEDRFYHVFAGLVTAADDLLDRVTRCRKEAESSGDSARIVRAMYNEGLLRMQAGEAASVENGLLQANSWFRRNGKSVLATKSYVNLSIFYESLDRKGQSLENAKQGIRYLNTLGTLDEQLRKLRGDLHVMVGHAYRLGAYSDASLLHLDSAEVDYQEVGASLQMAVVYSQRGAIELETGDAEKALRTLEKGLALCDTLSPQGQSTFAQLKYSQAYLFFNQKSFVDALREIRASTRMYKELGLESDYHFSRSLEGHILYAMEDGGAEFIFLDCLPVLQQYNRYDAQLEVLRSLAEINTLRGNSQEALDRWAQYTALKDTIEAQEKSKALEFAKVRYQTEKAELELGQKEKALETSEKLAASQRKFALTLGIGLSVALVLAVAALLAFLQKRRSNLLLARQKEQISAQNEEKALLLREIHHRVKNNLQVVSNLLELQSREVSDPQLQEITREGQSRVRSIALIHHSLYQGDTLTIDFEEFISKIAGELRSLYKKQAVVEFTISTDQLSLDIDTAVPLGLIINELLTNAFKYAFADDRAGSVLEVSIAKMAEHRYLLTVRDDGPGIPEGFDPLRASSMGLRLVRRLAAQLHGKFRYRYDAGACFEVEFKDSLARRMED